MVKMQGKSSVQCESYIFGWKSCQKIRSTIKHESKSLESSIEFGVLFCFEREREREVKEPPKLIQRQGRSSYRKSYVTYQLHLMIKDAMKRTFILEMLIIFCVLNLICLPSTGWLFFVTNWMETKLKYFIPSIYCARRVTQLLQWFLLPWLHSNCLVKMYFYSIWQLVKRRTWSNNKHFWAKLQTCAPKSVDKNVLARRRWTL